MEFILSHPLFVVTVGACITAMFGLLGFFLSQYAFTPKRCKGQIEKCIKERQEQSTLLHDRISKFANKVDEAYVRRDAILPRLDDIQGEISDLRNLIYKLIKLNGG